MKGRSRALRIAGLPRTRGHGLADPPGPPGLSPVRTGREEGRLGSYS
jgi:hypothetical protein